MSNKGGKMTQYINYRMRVTIQDGRMIVGTFLAFDKHMNLVIADADEIRITKNKGKEKDVEEKRSLGLTLIRGETVIAMAIDGPPPVPKNKFREPPQLPGGPGKGTSAGRGLNPNTFIPETGLGGPIKGVGGPSTSQMSSVPNPMGRGAPPGMMGVPPPGMMGRGAPPGMMGGPPPGMMGRGAPPGMMGGPPPGMMGVPPPGMMGRGAPPGMMGGPPPGMMGGPPPGMMGNPPPGMMGRGAPPGMMGGPPPGMMGNPPPGMMGRGTPPPGMIPPEIGRASCRERV